MVLLKHKMRLRRDDVDKNQYIPDLLSFLKSVENVVRKMGKYANVTRCMKIQQYKHKKYIMTKTC